MVEYIKKSSFLIAIVLMMVIILFLTNRSSQTADNEFIPISTDLSPETNSPIEQHDQNYPILVDIKGEIITPGVYEMSNDSRIEDVVKQAGGFTNEADQTVINLAQKVHDEMIIVVPSVNEAAVLSSNEAHQAKVRINYATVEEIQMLNGIGPSKANAIIAYREEHGFFNHVEDLLNVSGIGEKTLENIRDDIQVP
nr:ComEA family DNA-binding protein [Ornithinibacillus caprae]